jgi:hypothetical protein
MKINESDLENILRAAPRMHPPAGLKARLLAPILAPSNSSKTVEHHDLRHGSFAAWCKRWWPVVAPAGVSLACAVTFTVQHRELDSLKTQLVAAQSAPALVSTNSLRQTSSAETFALSTETAEIARLTQRASELRRQIAELESIKSANTELRAKLAGPAVEGLTRSEEETLAIAKARALSIRCINNLKQFGLAARIWAVDNQDISPPDILSMSNQLSTPFVLVCPAEETRQAAANWSVFSPANCSYEYLAPSSPSTEPSRVLSRCPIHGHIGLCDGSVQSSVATAHPDWLVTRDGKMYFEPKSNTPAPGGTRSSENSFQ